MNRLTLVISSLRGGGSERVLTVLANAWVSRGSSITLLTLDGGAPFYPLDPRVSHRPLGVGGVSTNPLSAARNNLRRIRELRRAITESRPGLVISFGDVTNVLTLLATRGFGIPVVVSERSDPAVYPIKRAFGILRKLLYPFADGVVVQSEEIRRYFAASVRARSEVIPNPVQPPKAVRQDSFASGKKIVSLGRLTREKGFDLLIDAFVRIAPKCPEWSLEIWGEGSERSRLERMAVESGLEGRVALPGQTTAAQEKLLEADLFVLPSRLEGFPNALCEAMACGLPVVATDCPSGPRQIVRPGVDGILVAPQDSAALAEGMRDLMGDPEKRRRLASRAPEVVERFRLDRVLGLWDAALDRAARRRRP